MKIQNQMYFWKNNVSMSKNYDLEKSPFHLSVIIPSEFEPKFMIQMSISGDWLLFFYVFLTCALVICEQNVIEISMKVLYHSKKFCKLCRKIPKNSPKIRKSPKTNSLIYDIVKKI